MKPKNDAVAAALVAPLTAEQADEIDRWMHGHAWRHQVENSIEVMKAIQAIASGAHIVVAAQAAEPSAAAPQPVIRSAEQERDAFEALVTPESRANVSPATREGWFDWFHEGWQAARAVPPASVEKVRPMKDQALENLMDEIIGFRTIEVLMGQGAMKRVRKMAREVERITLGKMKQSDAELVRGVPAPRPADVGEES